MLYWLSRCSPGSASPPALGTIEPGPMEPQCILLRCCCSSCRSPVGSCNGQGKWGMDKQGKSRDREGIPSFCSGPKVVFV